jgi:glycosyltransferase involved in cell wall biosynthesis
MSNVGQIIHIVRNDVAGDSRVLRSAKALAQKYNKFDVICVGYSEAYQVPSSVGNVLIDVVSVGSYGILPRILSRFFKYLVWHYKIVTKYKNHKVLVIHCHELTPLLIAIHLKYLTKSLIVYDAHELETECRTNKFDRFMKPVYRVVEKLGIKNSARMITVSRSIRDWYASKNRNAVIEVIYNCPEVSEEYDFDVAKKYVSRPIKYIYCGGLVPGRGIEMYLDIFSNNMNLELFFLGAGSLQGKIENFAAKFSNITYLGNSEPKEVVQSLAFADVSLCMIEDNTLTSRYCMPNKLFESIVAGLPVIVSNLPDLKRFVEENDAGWVVDFERDSLERFITSLDGALIEEKISSLISIGKKYTWLEERKKLLSIYNEILNK